MKKLLFITLIGFTFTNCNTENKTEIEHPIEETAIPFEEMVVRHIEADLNIPVKEKYDYKIYKAHLDNDSIIDAIITVNRLEFALEEAMSSGNSAKRAEIGFTGHYNYIFYFDGGLNKTSPSIPVPSSPHAELKVNFSNLASDIKQDFTVDYTIKNSLFRNYYFVFNHTPKQVFQWKIYDYLGEKNEEAIFIEYEDGSYSPIKDILIYDGKITNSDNVEDIYHFNPIIEKNDNLLHRFFYLEKEGKYFTKK